MVSPAPVFDLQGPAVVRKRDGKTLQPFDVEKIESAVCKAWVEAEGKVDTAELRRVSMIVSATIPHDVADVEVIQDAVETALMRCKKFKVAKAYILYREKRAEARRTRKAPDPVAISDYIHASKYARYVPEWSRREVFGETIDRLEDMHLRRFAHVDGLADEIRRAFGLVREKRVLPSMRSMQFGGKAIEANHNRMYNCSFSFVDRSRVFAEAMFLLLSGSGVGYSVQFDHVEKLPPLAYVDAKKVVHHVVEDTIEGWADALDALVRSYLDGHWLELSYFQIRPAGTPLKTSGGRAPGHLRLKESLESVRQVLHGAQGRKLRPVECHRIMCHAADAVLSGGIRRSAMICLFSLEDSEMVNLKTGDWYAREPWFENANNSVVLKRDEVKEKQFRRIFQKIREWGEPGFFFCDDTDHGTNPCVPAGTRVLTREGYRAIETRVDVPTVIWNGIEWRTVTPRVTGHDQPMVRVHLSDGTFLDCTDYHTWCVGTGYWSRDKIEERVRAVDLEEGDALMRYDMPVVEGGAEMPHAYTHGFYCADGVLEDAGRKAVQVYGVKRGLIEHLDCVRVGDYDEENDRTRVVLPPAMPEKFVVPVHASVQSRLQWLAGVLDGDGSVTKNPKSLGLQLSSINIAFLRDVRLMLTTLGVQAKIGHASEGGMRPMPDGRGGTAEYLTQPSYRLLINATDTHRLVRTGLKTYRLDLGAAKAPPQRDARRFVLVEHVERLAPASVVYCFTEESNHTGTFEGIVTGQCAEIGLNPKLAVDAETRPLIEAKVGGKAAELKDGDVLTGWALCNLTEINAAKLTSFDDFMEVARAATLIGTLQASYTSMPYLGWVSEVIAQREALLGVGMTGMLDAPQISCDPGFQRTVAENVKTWNAEFAAKLGIRPAARTTCVKPSGTTSLELGCVASGHHPHHAKRYIRRVTADELETVFQSFKAQNPTMCVKKPNGKWVIEFPVEAPEGAIVKDDVDALSFLEMVQSTQRNWVLPGTARPESSPGLNHNVSNTVSVRPDEWEAVARYVWDHRDSFTGVSCLSAFGDKDYAFAPNEAVVTEADEARWNQLVASYCPVDYAFMVESEDGTNLLGETACAGGACALT